MTLRDIQTAIKNRLEADTYFSGTPKVPVFSERKADITSEVERAVSRYGSCLVIGEPSLSYDGSMTVTQTVTLEAGSLTAFTSGNGGTAKHADDIALKALALLHDWVPGVDWTSPMWFTRLEPMGSEGNFTAWVLELKTQFIFDILTVTEETP